MPLPIFFKTIEQTIDSVNPNLPIVKLSIGGKTAFGGGSSVHYVFPDNAGGTTGVANHVGADNSRIFSSKVDIAANMTLLFNAHGSYVTSNFGQAITSKSDPFNFAGIALTPTQSVSDNWNQKTPAVFPPPRDSFAMTYMGSMQKIIIFGGENNGSLFNDTWSWDGTTWIKILPTVSPSARSNFSMRYDSTRKVIVLFGGITSGNVLVNTTYEFDGTNWALITPGASPSARQDATMVYDSKRGKIVLFGGRNGTSIMNDTWEYNGTTWTHITPTTSATIRYNHTMTYDSSRNKTILFGGASISTTIPTVTTTFTSSDTTIVVSSTTGFPNTGTVIIGSEFISYSGITATTLTHCVRGVYNTTAATHTSGSNVNLIIALGDTWEYDGTTWTQIFLAGTLPPVRAGSKIVYNSTKKTSLLFGGIGDPGANVNNLSDTWQYDGITWTQINIFGPSPRENFGMAYDSNRDKHVLFGGENSSIIGSNGETWEFGSPQRPVVVQTSGDGIVYYDASAGRPVPVVGDFLGPSSVNGTVTPLYDGYSPVFGIALEPPVPYTTTLSADISAVSSAIAVGTTTGFSTTGTIIIDNEQITYTGITSSTFTGCTRGANSTTAASHVASTLVYGTAPFNTTLNGSTVGLIKMRIRPFYGFIPPASPTITNFSPNAASVGDTITVNGSVFIGTSQLTINDTPSANASYSVVSNNQITFTVPAGAQKGTITVTNTSGPITSGASFITLPKITDISPLSGSVGTSVTITGFTFTYVTSVQFNGVSASFTFVDDSHITATIPAGGTSGDVTVTITYPPSDTRTATFHNFGVVPPPTIVNVAPLTGPIGAFVSVTGSGFTAGGIAVALVDVATGLQILSTAFTVFNDTTISMIVPNPGVQPSTNYYVRVTTAGGVILSSQQYTIIPIPKFKTSPTQTFSPTSGVAGNTINIIGDYGFTGLSSVQFAGHESPTITFFNDGFIQAVVPSVASAVDITGPIRVTSTGGTKKTDDSPAATPTTFTIFQAPTITSISPTSGKTGDIIVVSGTNLLSVNSVKFESMTGSAVFSIINSGQINVTVPLSSSGILASPSTCHIVVTKGALPDVTSSQVFTYYPPPTSLAISSPNADGGGINGGAGTLVTLTGSNLTQGGTPTVKVGTLGATVNSSSPSNVIITVPAGAGNGITLTTLGGPIGPITFNTLQPVYVGSFSPTGARVNFTPDTVNVYGSNFRPSPFMTVYVTDPQQGYSVVYVTFTYIDSGHITFSAGQLTAFSGFYPEHTLYITCVTNYPGGSYSSYVYGLVAVYAIG